ncbi:hypothetical protein [Streptomyces sp. NPDC004682]
MKDEDLIPLVQPMAGMDEANEERRARIRAAYRAGTGAEETGKDWTLRGLTEEDMGALGLTLQLRQEQALPLEADRWQRIIKAVRQAVIEEGRLIQHPDGDIVRVSKPRKHRRTYVFLVNNQVRGLVLAHSPSEAIERGKVKFRLEDSVGVAFSAQVKPRKTG